MNKTLPVVGNCHITGVVNVGGCMEFMVLQNTRLHLVFRMAEVISIGITKALTFPNRSFQSTAYSEGAIARA